MDMKTSYRQPLLPDKIILDDMDKVLVSLIQTGLPLTKKPYATLAEKLDSTESDVIYRIKKLIKSNVIKRFGVIVRHHELGYRANAMTVWDVPDERVRELGKRLGKYTFVTLCYRRPRQLPNWPYNLFTMIHGKNRHEVLNNITLLIQQCNLDTTKHDILFSSKRFKQRGAIYYKQNKIIE